MPSALTSGVHHVGLAVSKLKESAAFFTQILGFEEVRQVAEYPAIFVSDGHTLLTLWQTKGPTPAPFDRHHNVGLHHLALGVTSAQALDTLHERLVAHNVPIEFAPELLRGGPAKHLMCTEPSGVRVELIWAGS